jgi:toxin ParE1/3/4
MRRLELTLSAQSDLTAIFETSDASFGVGARRRYEAIFALALTDIAADPLRLGSLDRGELGSNVRTYHLRHCRARVRGKAGRVANPRHLLAYEFDDDRVLILRVLQDAMELERRLSVSGAERE